MAAFSSFGSVETPNFSTSAQSSAMMSSSRLPNSLMWLGVVRQRAARRLDLLLEKADRIESLLRGVLFLVGARLRQQPVDRSIDIDQVAVGASDGEIGAARARRANRRNCCRCSASDGWRKRRRRSSRPTMRPTSVRTFHRIPMFENFNIAATTPLRKQDARARSNSRNPDPCCPADNRPPTGPPGHTLQPSRLARRQACNVAINHVASTTPRSDPIIIFKFTTGLTNPKSCRFRSETRALADF